VAGSLVGYRISQDVALQDAVGFGPAHVRRSGRLVKTIHLLSDIGVQRQLCFTARLFPQRLRLCTTRESQL
jgi:hypothetical protein